MIDCVVCGGGTGGTMALRCFTCGEVLHKRCIPKHGCKIVELGKEYTVFTTNMWKTGPPPATGQFQRYPSRFWYYFEREYPVKDKKILHMFSGSMEWGDTTDIRSETDPTFVAPYNDLPIEDNTYDLVVADPPYNKGFASEWTTHDKDLPKPKHILIEAARVTKPGGIIAILHVIVIPAYKVANVARIALHGILAGPNNAIRVLNVFRKYPELS